MNSLTLGKSNPGYKNDKEIFLIVYYNLKFYKSMTNKSLNSTEKNKKLLKIVSAPSPLWFL